MGNEGKVKEIVFSIRRLYRAVYLDTSKMSRGFGLTASQSGVLRELLKNGDLSSADLSRKLFVTPSNITGIIDRLEKKALVARQPKAGDRRVILIALTPDGRDLAQRLPDPIENKLILGLGDLDHEKVERIAETMCQLLDLIDAGGSAEAHCDALAAEHATPMGDDSNAFEPMPR